MRSGTLSGVGSLDEMFETAVVAACRSTAFGAYEVVVVFGSELFLIRMTEQVAACRQCDTGHADPSDKRLQDRCNHKSETSAFFVANN